ncbi:hypothetical protein SEA_NHAGOS_69 [Gordonia phage NHagos]|nr:hypothetical protein SEA_NHAGOS_69 [Gordonia phage NHagos]
MAHIDCDALPEGAIIIRRTTVTRYIDPADGEPDIHIDCDDGSGDEEQVHDTTQIIGDLESAKLGIWDASRD